MKKFQYEKTVFTLAAIMLALMLAASCSLFQKDPVGASLLTIKTGYEETVKTVGRLYINGEIDEQQLRLFRTEANKFYLGYNAMVAAYGTHTLIANDAKLDQLKLGLTALESLVNAFVNHAAGQPNTTKP